MQKHQDNLASRINGNALQPLSGVTVTVTNDATGLPAALYSDNGVTLITSEITTDDNGGYSFYAADGKYTITFRSSRLAAPIERKLILEDPDDNPAASLAQLAASGGGVLVGAMASGSGAVLRTQQDKARERVTLFDFIPVAQHAAILAGTSTYDCTAHVVAAFAANNVVYAGPGLYNISTFELGNNKELRTSGKATTFQQIAGTAIGTRPINIVGSNVYVGSMTVRGNIATDTNEQNHFIFAQATASTGNLRNIVVGDIDAYDIRGDAVYFGANSPNTLNECKVGCVYGDNILRNVISICGGNSIEIQSITCGRVGLMALDIEPEPYNMPVSGVRVGYIKGRSVGLNSASVNAPISGVEIGTMLLDPAYSAACSPAYAPGAGLEDGLTLRNLKSAKIKHAEISGFNRCASFTIYSGGELGAETVEIDYLKLRSCSLTDVTYNAFVNGVTIASNKFIIGHVDAIVTGANKRVFAGLRAGSIKSATVDVQAGASFMRDVQDVQVGFLTQTGAGGFCLTSANRVAIKGGTMTGDRLASFSDKCTFENFTATASVFLFSSGQEDHTILNSTLNTDFYSFGTGIRSYLHTLRFGAYQVWVDVNGRLRRKGGVPTSDTDGAIAHVTTKGATGSRPTFTSADIGGMYFDTTLAAAGKPIFWTGTAWVDATGATV